MFGQGVGGDWRLITDIIIVAVELSKASFWGRSTCVQRWFQCKFNFAFASMMFKSYHFVFDTTSWSSLIFIYTSLCVDWSLPGRVISHLNVSSVHSSDGGLYRCQAQNSVSFYGLKDIIVHNMYLYLRWGWSLTPQGWMCMVRHLRGVCRMSPLSQGFLILYQQSTSSQRDSTGGLYHF